MATGKRKSGPRKGDLYVKYASVVGISEDDKRLITTLQSRVAPGFKISQAEILRAGLRALLEKYPA